MTRRLNLILWKKQMLNFLLLGILALLVGLGYTWWNRRGLLCTECNKRIVSFISIFCYPEEWLPHTKDAFLHGRCILAYKKRMGRCGCILGAPLKLTKTELKKRLDKYTN